MLLIISFHDVAPGGRAILFFGTDYGVSIMEWILNNYRVIEQAGAPPLKSDNFGIQLLARKK